MASGETSSGEAADTISSDIPADGSPGPVRSEPAVMRLRPPVGTAPDVPAPCPTCGPTMSHSLHFPRTGTPPGGWIYAMGRIDPRFPRISVEKEFAQAGGDAETAGLTDRQATHRILSEPRNRFLARQLCWVLTISGQDAYVVIPRDSLDIGLLVDALRDGPDPNAVDVTIGARGPIAPPELCNGASLPTLLLDQLYSFDRESLLKGIPRPPSADAKSFAASAAELLDRILASTENLGVRDEDRAINYLALRDPSVYARVAELFGRDYSLTAIQARPWALSVSRRVVEVVFTFTQRKSAFVEKFAARVDVNDEFPFLVSKMSPYSEH
jgi:hypothetical protein